MPKSTKRFDPSIESEQSQWQRRMSYLRLPLQPAQYSGLQQMILPLLKAPEYLWEHCAEVLCELLRAPDVEHPVTSFLKLSWARRSAKLLEINYGCTLPERKGPKFSSKRESLQSDCKEMRSYLTPHEANLRRMQKQIDKCLVGYFPKTPLENIIALRKRLKRTVSKGAPASRRPDALAALDLKVVNPHKGWDEAFDIVGGHSKQSLRQGVNKLRKQLRKWLALKNANDKLKSIDQLREQLKKWKCI
jgi:hypothetical protein